MITITPMLEGPRTAIYHIYLLNEGSANDLVNEVIVDPGLMVPPAERLVVEEIEYNFAGFDAKLNFDNGTVGGSLIWILGEGNSSGADFTRFGGLKDKEYFDGSGALRLSTVGFNEAGDEGSLIIKIRKAGKPTYGV